MQLESPRKHRLSLGLTPLIDVVFILLIFFMLATTFMEWREVPLVLAGQGGETTDSSTAVTVVRIEATGDIWLDGVAIAKETLATRLVELQARESSTVVRVRPDGDVPLQRLLEVIEQLDRAGIANVSLQEE